MAGHMLDELLGGVAVPVCVRDYVLEAIMSYDDQQHVLNLLTAASGSRRFRQPTTGGLWHAFINHLADTRTLAVPIPLLGIMHPETADARAPSHPRFAAAGARGRHTATSPTDITAEPLNQRGTPKASFQTSTADSQAVWIFGMATGLESSIARRQLKNYYTSGGLLWTTNIGKSAGDRPNQHPRDEQRWELRLLSGCCHDGHHTVSSMFVTLYALFPTNG
ncbi:hypothetical protein FN846DRAFT_893282 [Sphaerosporella brunnea]|uniref:Uncharacterized protein n=1 Tax=Sphaerosporella brunnea TaxID=1250544 RepID=A0A5J5ELD2_9PEZI|nr:hypothetical protein FN846DRAFT_893282 [Sphaerosporella brunnea]